MTPIDTLGQLAELAQSPTHAVPSPCISVCRMDADTSLCQGCYRTIEEVIVWGRQNDQQRRQVWQQIVLRAGLTPARISPAGPRP
jgi:predicted Fe-S protein YdhL (DUF1289 family)